MPESLTNTSVYLQPRCALHRFIRSRDTSAVVERPERLRAVSIGLAAAIARIQKLIASGSGSGIDGTNGQTDGGGNSAAAASVSRVTLQPLDLDDLAGSMAHLSIVVTPPRRTLELPSIPHAVGVEHSEAVVDILNNPAVKFIHGDIDGDVYLEKLSEWVRSSSRKIAEGCSEIPEGYSQGDLYLCQESLDAIQGALGTVCEAVDHVVKGDPQSAFVAIRPPGHHCGEDTPSGFCFVNNVAVAAAHAHLTYGINRAIVFDIDLHHGNGTQSIAWQINEEAYRKELEGKFNPDNDGQPSLRMFYGSVHDILSFPCEDGQPALVQAASTSLHGPHGQYIENIHLKPYTSEDHFWNELYAQHYSTLFNKARSFVQDTNSGNQDDVIVFISCGFDACEHEYESMSRHGRKVPTSFYYRFAKDARKFANEHAKGRIISVLEGGYSDRALTSGAMAHLTGLVDLDSVRNGLSAGIDEGWWSVDNLTKLEKVTKKRKGGRPSVTGTGTGDDEWLSDTLATFVELDAPVSRLSTKAQESPTPTGMKLRGRNASKPSSKAGSPAASPKAQKVARGRKVKPQEPESEIEQMREFAHAVPVAPATTNLADLGLETTGFAPKKPPKVVLKLGRHTGQ